MLSLSTTIRVPLPKRRDNTLQSYMPIMMILIILVGFFLRLYHLSIVPLRGDEAFTVQYWAQQPLADSLAKTATIEPHPILTYALFRGWGLAAGTSAFTMRLLPAMTNVLGIAALYAIGRRIGGRKLGLVAALLFALHPFEIWHAQDARNYGIWAGASAVTLALGIRALRTKWRIHWIAYAIIAAITANIFYFEWLTTAAFGLYVAIAYWKERRVFGIWLAAALPAILTSAASFLILQGSLIATGSYGGTTASRLDFPRLFTWFLPTLSVGETIPANFSATLWPFILLILCTGLLINWRKNHRMTLLLAILAFVPMLLLAGASSRLNIFNPRYMLSAVPAFLLLFAVLIVDIRSVGLLPASVRRILPYALAGVWLILAGYSLNNAYFDSDYAKSKNWPALIQYVRENVTKEDLVIQLSVDPAFGYYYDAPADAPALPEKPSQPASDIEQKLEIDSTHYQSIWIVGQTFPDWPNTGVVENWLDNHMQFIRGGQIDGLNYRQYVPWQVAPAEIEGQPLATFDTLVELVGAHVFLPPDTSGSLTVWFDWKPIKQSATPLKIFVHLIGDTNPETGSPLWTQDDHFPQNGRVNTDSWTVNTVYRDIYSLPLASVIPGEYTIEIGFYDPMTNQRLQVGDGDSFVLQKLIVK